MVLIVHSPNKFEIDVSKVEPDDVLEIHMDDFTHVYVTVEDDGEGFALIQQLAPKKLSAVIDEATYGLHGTLHIAELRQRMPLKIALRRKDQILCWLPELPSKIFAIQHTTRRRAERDLVLRSKPRKP